ncbi:hypothetical protein CDAR_399711 [Caerostris darwini]|uniref:Uncharacterized protein n=1 Tax=Caerostris darwini TaxID=1538125 RepID=A0AAV4S537_9ARAC|nr:hypothetical protein CDAR_399711 [Caerostris darwini]
MVMKDEEVMGVICRVCTDKNMQVNMSGEIDASATVCLGPHGLNISGAVSIRIAIDGTAIFISLCDVIAEWSREFKTLLIEKVRKILTDAGIYVLDALKSKAQAAVNILWILIQQTITDFCRDTLGIEVIESAIVG